MALQKVCIIGSGNWGSVVAKIASSNILKMAEFHDTVKMWVFPENVNGKCLVDIINTQHQNVKYLPNIQLPQNLVADGDLLNCVRDSDYLVFVLPHQFLERTCETIRPHLKSNAKAISFIKGLFCSAEGIELVSERIRKSLSIPVCVVSGANVANEVAANEFAEATLGFNSKEFSVETIRLLQLLFHQPTFHVTPIDDIAGVEIAGALKNVIALAAGFVDAMGYKSNTKAAILRLGMLEMHKFGKEFFKELNCDSFWQSSGFADLITTCYAGRNRRCAEEFAKSDEDWEEIEKRLLKGQKLQGPSTCKEVYEFLERRGRLDDYKMFRQIYRISFGENGEKASPRSIVTCFEEEKEMPSLVRCKR